MHLKVLQLRYCGRDSIIQVRIDLIFIMVPLGEQKQMEEAQTYKTSILHRLPFRQFRQFSVLFRQWTANFVHTPVIQFRQSEKSYQCQANILLENFFVSFILLHSKS